MRHVTPEKGYLLVLILIFGGIFITIITAFMAYAVTQHRSQIVGYNKERALSIAEAGLNYYKWYLAHNPDDMTNGTSLPGPYVKVYSDPEDGPIGEFSLDISSASACGDIYAVDITSTAHTYDEPGVGRKVYGRYARPTVAEFAYIINSNVWAGDDRTIIGPYHSNGGIRMDGTNNSTVTSGQATWSCTSSFGCSYTTTKNGVFGDGPNSDLWSFPSTPINFTGLSVDLAAMQNKAQHGGGLYIPPSNKKGYQIVFQSNGTVKVYRVNKTIAHLGYTTEDGWQTENNIIDTTSRPLVGTYTIPSSCSVIFVEDNVWLEGVVKGKVTIAAADVDTTGNERSIILNNNITYANDDSGLLAIAEENILIGVNVPDAMTLNGIFVAQNGRFGRNYYCNSNCDPYHAWSESLPYTYMSYYKRSTLTVNGTIVSNGREGTQWTNSSGAYISGFQTRYNSYDRDLVADPPPLTPKVSDSYEFIEWREENK
jgi:hypothetical protein